MMLEDGTPETWIYKRVPSMRRPRKDVVRLSAEGIADLAPEAILFFKAKYRRDKDEVDFEKALPKLDEAQQRWLKAGIEAAHPDHAWIRRLNRR